MFKKLFVIYVLFYVSAPSLFADDTEDTLSTYQIEEDEEAIKTPEDALEQEQLQKRRLEKEREDAEVLRAQTERRRLDEQMQERRYTQVS